MNIAIVIARFLTKRPQLGKDYLDVADSMVVWTGTIYFLIALFSQAFILLVEEQSEDIITEGIRINRISYSLPLLIQFLILISVSQLFRLKKIRKSNLLRLLIALVVLITVKLEDYVIIVTSFHRDYLPPGKNFIVNLLSKYAIELIFFGMVFFLVYSIKKFSGIRKNREKNENRTVDEDL